MFLLALACSQPASLDTPVRATLEDGQILIGAVATETLRLEGGFGQVDIPLQDVGEVLPVEGGALSGSGDHVTVWLRNGSELRGRWSDPELAMEIEVGGNAVPVDLPMTQLLRFQLMDGLVWPEGEVLQVRTEWGDDFLVDAEKTRIEFENDLGIFAPFLSECVSVEPLDDGSWRVELDTGTVLIGDMTTDAITFALPMGPATIEVPLERIVSMDQQTWGSYEDNWTYPSAAPAEEIELPAQSQKEGAAVRGMRSNPTDIWFENDVLDSRKKSL